MTTSRFFALSGELRNEIYELAFIVEHKQSTDLCRAEPPSKALLLTCRQVYEEVSQIYKIAYQRYWSEGVFALEFNTAEMINTTRHQLSRFRSDDFQHINSLTITSSKTFDFGLCTVKSSLLDFRGLWKRELTAVPEYHSRHVVARRRDTDEVDIWGSEFAWDCMDGSDDDAEAQAGRALLNAPGLALVTMEEQIRDILARRQTWL